MKQQILVIHGGDSYKTEEEYLATLKAQPLKLEWMRSGKSWKGSLQETLGDEYDVLSPYFPLRENARYEEWKLVFEKILELVDDNIILLGHSLGGIFLAKYLSENTSPKKVRAVFLIAAPYSMSEFDMSPEFDVAVSLDTLKAQVSDVFIYHSEDDMVVPFSAFEKYKAELPDVHLRTFTDRAHFNMESFPEIIEDIKSCTKL